MTSSMASLMSDPQVMASSVSACLNRCLNRCLYRRRHLLLTSVVLSSIAFIALVANQSSKRQTLPDVRHNPPKPPPPPNPTTSTLDYVPPLRVVHLDMKGAPPTLRYFAQLLPLLASLGANALLLEWEDMFPFRGALAGVKAGNAYTEADVRSLLRLAEDNSLHVIPLIQTFGHLEFVLKLEPFSPLREVPQMPQALCPTNNASFALITAMVDQVLALHPRTRFLHIGCDEVFHLGVCDRCRRQDRDQLFLQHVTRVAQYVVERHAPIIPIVWDDMLRQIPLEAIRASGLATLGVEPMVWTYIKDIYRFVPYAQWSAFAQLFPRVWTASAFKGAFGETLTVPNALMHFENNNAWIEVMREQKHAFLEIRGLVLTGWQRYDHLATLCELLPSSVPSLALNLLLVSSGGQQSQQPKHIFSRFRRLLHCKDEDMAEEDNTWQSLDADPYLFARAGSCAFPGSAIYRLMQTHAEVVKRVDDFVYDVSVHKAWLTSYNTRHNISSPYRVDEGLQDFSGVYYGVQSLMRNARRALADVYDNYTVFEWIEQNIYPSLLKMDRLMNDSLALKRAQYWPRRPLTPPQDLLRRLSTTADEQKDFELNNN